MLRNSRAGSCKETLELILYHKLTVLLLLLLSLSRLLLLLSSSSSSLSSLHCQRCSCRRRCCQFCCGYFCCRRCYCCQRCYYCQRCYWGVLIYKSVSDLIVTIVQPRDMNFMGKTNLTGSNFFFYSFCTCQNFSFNFIVF